MVVVAVTVAVLAFVLPCHTQWESVNLFYLMVVVAVAVAVVAVFACFGGGCCC